MRRTFYQFLLTHRGGPKEDPRAVFAEAAFLDHEFPKTETGFDVLSRYLEERADPDMLSRVFDELWEEYRESD
ncbi:YozE family protein [Bhargavaea beijingensis]|uniref:UPF0346 protein EJA12_09540 n=1 Tax=Bhargavaea beijingensis TaxID=426756 RepID=A0A1G7DCZ1_9BACL|nr:YozE family protein [Bhargavaea beijingensis]MCW1929154.1 YozE family protein [Bhargavaea beijingensis]RSK30950.1 YozE family protein [Bhargavaea beijingensis]SDE49484.1 Uncharacterized protein YozE, UPF0346 family [Bhargavaea beijingensis]